MLLKETSPDTMPTPSSSLTTSEMRAKFVQIATCVGSHQLKTSHSDGLSSPKDLPESPLASTQLALDRGSPTYEDWQGRTMTNLHWFLLFFNNSKNYTIYYIFYYYSSFRKVCENIKVGGVEGGGVVNVPSASRGDIFFWTLRKLFIFHKLSGNFPGGSLPPRVTPLRSHVTNPPI